MSYADNARALKDTINAAGALLTDEQAVTVPTLYPAWGGEGVSYLAGDRVLYGGSLYKCLQTHASQPDWTPEAAVSLWARVLIPDPALIPDWEQPDSTNPYMRGDRVTHNGKTWQSDIDNNVWEPGVYGWTEVTV